MSKYKLCPTCKEQNDPRSMECINCGTDLMGISITDTEVVAPAVQAEHTEESSPTTERSLVRVCYCGEVNPAQARKCQKCNEDISDILPIPSEVDSGCRYQLSSIDSDYVYPLPEGSIIIGREHGMRECLIGKQYVSRIHAKLTVENGIAYIENLSNTNYTYVNNIRIPAGRTPLKAGDEVALGGIIVNGTRQEEAAYFIVGTV